jgi:hypothetical protein
MNDLEKIIGNLSGLKVWINSSNVNGIGTTNPSDGTNLSSVVDCSGNSNPAIIGSGGINQVVFKSSGGLNNLPYFQIEPSLNKALFIEDKIGLKGGSNANFSFFIVASNITDVTANRGIVQRSLGGVGTGNFSTIGKTTNSVYSTVIPASNFTSTEFFVNTSTIAITPNFGDTYILNRSYISYVFSADIFNGKYFAANSVGLISSSFTPNITTNWTDSTNYPITFGFNRNIGSGSNINIASSNQDFYLYEFGFFNRTLLQNEVYKVQSYLKQKYNI